MRLLKASLFVFFLFASIFSYLWYSVPKEELFKWQTYSRLYYGSEGTLLRFTLADDDRYRLPTQIQNIPQELINATVLYEDRYFFSHPGINIPAVWRAFVSTYFTGSRRVGASTITMQVARIAFNLRSKTVLGKLKQMFYALWLESHYTKDEILELYFSVVSYGGNIEGIEAASQMYFHKSAQELNLPEILTLVVIPQNPVNRNPKTTSGYQKILKTREYLYEKYKQEYQEDLNKDKKQRQDSWMQLPLKIYKNNELPFLAPHFIHYVQEKNPYLRGSIKTSLKYKKQKILEQEVTAWLKKNKSLGFTNTSALLMNTKSMDIEAWVGSADFFNEKILGQVDGVRAKRSPGSTLKPFVYALAMDQGLIHPQSLLEDAPYRFGAYTPENFDKVFLGPVSATNALITSRNVPAVRLSSQLKEPSLYEFLQGAKISKMKPSEHYGMSIALGGLEMNMLELGFLYASLANEGRLKTLGLLKGESTDLNQSVLSPESAWLTLNMLKKNPPPDKENYLGLEKKKNLYAWKTGTSYAFRDAWTAGLSKDYALIVWVGNFDGKGNSNFVGRKAAAPLFFNIMQAIEAKDVFQDKDVLQETALNLSLVDICKTTGMLPGKFCPRIKKSWFIPGVSPIETSNVYRQIPINIETGQRACFHNPDKTRLETFEFWPSNILRIFAMAGVKKRVVPSLEKACANLDFSSTSSAPKIQSPANNLIYTLQSDKQEGNLIPFQAILDADSHKAFWFVNKAYIGTSKPSEPFFWKAKAGKYIVRVVDEKGLSASLPMEVQLAN